MEVQWENLAIAVLGFSPVVAVGAVIVAQELMKEGYPPGKFGVVPRPKYATHGTSYDNAVSILKQGLIKRGYEESVSFSLDGVGWGDVSFVFPFSSVKSITKPVFYADMVTFVVFFDKFRLSAWYAIPLKEVYSEIDVPLSLAKSIIVSNRKHASMLMPLAVERELSILTSPPDTPLYRWGEEVKELILEDEKELVLRKIEAYNRMIARVYDVDLREVEEAIRKVKSERSP